MGLNTCKYCNNDIEWQCRCHELTIEDIQEGGIIGCDSAGETQN